MPTKQPKELALQEMTLQQMVDKETSEREILVNFISHHMKKGVDYAAIHISKNCDNKYNCTNKYHFSKDSLTKAGAEKIGSLLRLRPDVVKDADTWEMSGSKAGLFCYRCNLYNRVTNQLEGMGLGACSIEEKGSANNAIKIAKKRAFVDAILSTGALSDFFTQDIEDMVHTDGATIHPLSQETKALDNPRAKSGVSTSRITVKQKQMIQSQLKRLGKDMDWLQAGTKVRFGVNDYHELSITEASKVIESLITMQEEQTEEPEITEEDMEKIQEAIV